MSEAQNIIQRMNELTQFVSQSNDIIKGGQMVDLTGLDDEVASLCDRTVALHPQEAMQVQPVMAELISKLEELGRTLQQFQNNLGSQGSQQ